jgi:hypothetical protein
MSSMLLSRRAITIVVLAVVVTGDFAASGGLAGLASTARESAAPATVMVPAAADISATATTEANVENYAASALAATDTPEIGVTPAMGVAAPQSTVTPEGTDQRLATVGPPNKNVEPTATQDGTQVALALAPTAPSATPETTNDAFATEPPPVAPRPGGLGPLRVFEIVMGVLAVLLGLGAWFTRRS